MKKTKIIKHNYEEKIHSDNLREKFNNLNIKKILLIQPPDSDKKIFNFGSAKRGRLWNYPPYGLGVLAKRLQKENIDVEILNLNNEILKFIKLSKISEENFDFDKVWIESLNKKLSDFKPCLVGLTSMFSQSHEIIMQLSKHIKAKNKHITIAAGGVHVTNSLVEEKTFEKFVKDMNCVDFFFTYEADLSFINFIKSINNKINYDQLGQMVVKINDGEFIFINKNEFSIIYFDNHLAQLIIINFIIYTFNKIYKT